MRSCRSRSSSSRSQCGNRCLVSGASDASWILFRFYNLLNFVVCLDCFLRCNFRRCLDCVLISVLVRLVLVSVLCCLLDLSIILDWGKRVPLVMSSLFDILHVILHLTERGPGLWYSSRAANLSHSSLPAGFRWSHCENCVVRIELVRLVLVDDDTFPDDRGELWVTSLAILACCRSAPAATAVLNSWTQCRV